MKKKKIGIFVCIMLLTTIIPVAGINVKSPINTIEEDFEKNNGEKLDQEQPIQTGNTFVIGEVFRAQSFVPTKNKLTRVELFVFKEGTMNADFVVPIRENSWNNLLYSVYHTRR